MSLKSKKEKNKELFDNLMNSGIQDQICAGITSERALEIFKEINLSQLMLEKLKAANPLTERQAMIFVLEKKITEHSKISRSAYEYEKIKTGAKLITQKHNWYLWDSKGLNHVHPENPCGNPTFGSKALQYYKKALEHTYVEGVFYKMDNDSEKRLEKHLDKINYICMIQYE